MYVRYVCIVLLVFVLSKIECSSDKTIVRARIESCSGCKLKDLPDLRKFIYQEAKNYENVEVKRIPGAPPELIFLNENDEEIERIQLENKSRDECHEILRANGFKLQSNNEL